jgi:hypothetical protein
VYRTCPAQTASRSATATRWASKLVGSAITGSLFGGVAALRKGPGFSFERARHRHDFLLGSHGVQSARQMLQGAFLGPQLSTSIAYRGRGRF